MKIKMLLITFVLSLSANAFAQTCKVFLKNDLNRLSSADELSRQKLLDDIITKILLKKGHSITKSEEEADLVLTSEYYFSTGPQAYKASIEAIDTQTGAKRLYSYRDDGIFFTSEKVAIKEAAKKLPECFKDMNLKKEVKKMDTDLSKINASSSVTSGSIVDTSRNLIKEAAPTENIDSSKATMSTAK